MAAELQDEHLARSLQRARMPIAAGVAGECEQCFEDSPRLVGGRCAFCRDGRRRPANPTGRLVSSQLPTRVDVSSPHDEKVSNMGKSITFVADGAVLVEIQRRTAGGTSNNRAALDLVEAGLAALTDSPAAPASGADLPSIDADALVGEIARRLSSLVDAGAIHAADQRVAAAEERAIAAEARADVADVALAKIREALAA